MTTLRRLTHSQLELTVDDVELNLSMMSRPGTGRPIVFLHGFGSTKEDYADVIQQPELADRPILAYDAPGCGASECSELSAVTVPFLVDVAETVLSAHGIDGALDLIGHSMGGLTGLLLAKRQPDRIAHFVNIEGNLAPEDCFLSRQILDYPADNPNVFFNEFIARAKDSRYAASALYAASLAHKVRAEAAHPIFSSMVALSDNADLLQTFLNLPARKMLMYGDQNNGLTYLPQLADSGVELAEITRCGHFPMYSNAPAMWDHLTRFLSSDDPASGTTC